MMMMMMILIARVFSERFSFEEYFFYPFSRKRYAKIATNRQTKRREARERVRERAHKIHKKRERKYFKL
jgi:hypothetical protein